MDRHTVLLEFGAAVRRKRLELGLSQEELADRCGLHRNYAGSVERGERNVSLVNIYLFAAALGCEARDLLPLLRDAG